MCYKEEEIQRQDRKSTQNMAKSKVLESLKSLLWWGWATGLASLPSEKTTPNN